MTAPTGGPQGRPSASHAVRRALDTAKRAPSFLALQG
jgi:hypothetical protein